MENNNLKILTIIATYNGSKWIKKCIISLLESDYKTDVFIIDNASTDDTVSILESFTGIKIHKNVKNLGFGQANNIGLQYSLENNYDYVFLLNQDAWIENSTLSVLLDVAEQNKDYGVLSPLHYYSDEKSLEYFFSTKLSPSYCKNFLSDVVVKGIEKMDDVYGLNFIHAAAWFLPIKTIKNIGGFDPLFFHYGEDNNYCGRLNFHNIKIGVTPKTKFYHDCKTNSDDQILSRIKKIDRVVLDFKIIFSNIKYKATYLSISLYVLKLLLNSLRKFIILDFNGGSVFFGAALNCLTNISDILKSRKINSNVRSNYLLK